MCVVCVCVCVCVNEYFGGVFEGTSEREIEMHVVLCLEQLNVLRFATRLSIFFVSVVIGLL